MKRSANAEDKRRLDSISKMGCIVCELAMGFHDSPAEVHHVRLRHGWGRSSHQATIPLCPIHHTGKYGVHNMGREEFAERYGYSEIELLRIIDERIAAISFSSNGKLELAPPNFSKRRASSKLGE